MTMPIQPTPPPPADISARLHDLAVVLGEPLTDSAEYTAFHATHQGAPAVVHVLHDSPVNPVSNPHHATGLRTALRTMPVPAARLRHLEARIAVYDPSPGTALHSDRYPGPLPESPVLDLLEQLDKLHAWQPAGLVHEAPTYELLSWYLDAGLLHAANASAIRSLTTPRTPLPPLQPQLGIWHPAGFTLHADTITVTAVTGLARRLPGHDWAMLRLLWAPSNPWLIELLDRRAERDMIRGAYAVNLMLAACHEIALHAGDRATDRRVQRLLADNHAMARAHLKTVYEGAW